MLLYNGFVIKNARVALPVPTVVVYLLAVLVLMSFTVRTSHAANLWQEKQWAEQLQAVIPAKEIIWLETPDVPTLALYHETAQEKIQGGVIIVPPPGSHPDEKNVISPLRHTLPRYGWSTLSIQTPTIEEVSKETEIASLMQDLEPRLLVAVNFFKDHNIQNIVLIGYGLGATLSADFLSKNKQIDTDITAFVGISMNTLQGDMDWRDSSEAVAKLTIPVLDVYAEFDLPEVLAFRKDRLRAARIAGRESESKPKLPYTRKVQRLARNVTGNLNFRQKQIPGADPFYTDKDQLLVKVIRGWLKNYASGIEIPVK